MKKSHRQKYLEANHEEVRSIVPPISGEVTSPEGTSEILSPIRVSLVGDNIATCKEMLKDQTAFTSVEAAFIQLTQPQ